MVMGYFVWVNHNLYNSNHVRSLSAAGNLSKEVISNTLVLKLTRDRKRGGDILRDDLLYGTQISLIFKIVNSLIFYRRSKKIKNDFFCRNNGNFADGWTDLWTFCEHYHRLSVYILQSFIQVYYYFFAL